MEPLIEQIQNPPTEVEFPVAVEWLQKHQFRARDDNDHSVTIDTALDDGGDGLGMSPIRLLTAVAGCTSIDIVDILRKSRQDLIGLTVSARGIQNEEYPHYFKEIHLFYKVRGNNLDKSRVERAIRLSEEKYCSVGATVNGKAMIYSQYLVEDLTDSSGV